jgi:hypothetical protein
MARRKTKKNKLHASRLAKKKKKIRSKKRVKK